MQVLPLNQVPGQGRGDENIVSEVDMGHMTGEKKALTEEGGKVGRENLSSRVHPRSAR